MTDDAGNVVMPPDAATITPSESTVIETGAPADAPSKFGGTVDPSRAPTWVYPADGVLVPPNLNELEFHFMPGTGNTLFELTFQGTFKTVHVFTPCVALGTGCVYTPGDATWRLIADAEKGQNPVVYTLKGVDGTTPGAVGVSASQSISFGQEDIVGGLYYWNAGAGQVKRYDFGLRSQMAETFMDAPRAGATTCVGCHVLSRDGKKISVGLDIPAPSPFKVFDVATRMQTFAQGTQFTGGANFFTFSPDGSQIMTSNGLSIVLRDASNGNALKDPVVSPGAMPDWSPDGMKLVYAKPNGTLPPCLGGFACGQPGVDKGSIETMTLDATNQWVPGSTLVPYTAHNNFYPSYSPDGKFVIFNQSPTDANSFDDHNAQVWFVSTTGGNAVQLATASTGGDSWPKWAPNVQNYRGGQLMWFTFSSRRAYGLRAAAGGNAQIWMAAFDPARAAQGRDPGIPAFRLPFQELSSGNHIAQWVTKVERMSCGDVSMCGVNEFCQGGKCLPRIN